MNAKRLVAPAMLATIGMAALVGSVATADPAKDGKPAAAEATPEMKLPPGWTADDMKACMVAGTPGQQHEQLAKDVGTWKGKNTLWMAPGTDPIATDSTSVVTPIMGGGYTKLEMSGEMPGMGPFNGLALYGFDNVAQRFACTWIDSASTGMLHGNGEASADGKTITWTFNYHCPITKNPAPLRQVETRTGEKTKTLEMFGVDPNSGNEFRMMRIELTKQ